MLPKACSDEPRQKLGGFVIDLDDGEFPTVGEAANGLVLGRLLMVHRARLRIELRIDERKPATGLEPSPYEGKEGIDPIARNMAKPESGEDGVHRPVGLGPRIADMEMRPELVSDEALPSLIQRSGGSVVERELAL